MNTPKDKDLDKLVETVMTRSKLDMPSSSFTSHVMAEVNSIKTSQVTTYKPLISKTTWVVLAVILIAISVYSITQTTVNEQSLLNNALSRFGNLFELNLSNNIAYVFMLFAVMFLVQLSWLKHYFNKRLDV